MHGNGERSGVLVVDDDDAIRRLVVRVLRREGYDVSEASHGGEALELLRSRPFAVMVLDLMMPVMSGPELLDYLDSHDDVVAPRVVVISAAAERDLGRLRSPLVQAVIRKPFDLLAIVTAVRYCAELPAG